MLKEACVENFTLIPQFIEAGINRIELCDNLAVGGTTVSLGVMQYAQQYCQQHHIPLMVLIRPRGGDFVYNQQEVNIMLADIIEAKKYGVAGIVIGALTKTCALDIDVMKELLHMAQGLDITFHMAFDAMPELEKYTAIDWLAAHDVSRILSHGGSATIPIEQTLGKLQQYIAYADERISIMPGGGITYQNVNLVCDTLQVEEVHGTKILELGKKDK